MKLLAVDVGNTNTVLGIFEGERLGRTWRIASTSQDLRKLRLRLPHGIEGVVVSSVVPRLAPVLNALSRRLTGKSALFVSPKMKMPIRVRIKNSSEVGPDRIVNAVAAYSRWKCGLIIVDLGTATTCDVVTPKGDYIGGTISPGIGIANTVLHEKTALLPLVPIAKPKRAVGNSTVTAIQSGVFYGYAALIDGLVKRIQKEVRFRTKVIATGGLANLIGRACETIDAIDPNLTLKGLQKLQDENGPRSAS